MPHILVFDVNETLLNLRALEPHFVRVFGDAGVLEDWFQQVILYAEALTLANRYQNFGEVAQGALEMIADGTGVALKAEDAQTILVGARRLPAYPEVPESLQRLKDAGMRLVALTNSSTDSVEEQMRSAGLTAYFERVFSVEAVRKFKPAPEPYRMVARELRVETSGLRMIAAHAWDVGGAMQAGCAAAFVARRSVRDSRKALFPGFPRPDIVGANLREVSEMILLREAH
jgi:2-haloacid dehalogenase